MRAKGGISYPLKGFALILRSVFGPKALKKDKVTRVDEDSGRSKEEGGVRCKHWEHDLKCTKRNDPSFRGHLLRTS